VFVALLSFWVDAGFLFAHAIEQKSSESNMIICCAFMKKSKLKSQKRKKLYFLF